MDEAQAKRIHEIYFTLDQQATRNGTWDYDDPDFACKLIAEKIEAHGLENYTEAVRPWLRRILWLYHHHAISCALRKRDKERAQYHSRRALEYQPADHPNQLTRLLYYLVHDDLEMAKNHTRIITGVERHTAEDLLREFQHRGGL